jgi:hypothetical protein
MSEAKEKKPFAPSQQEIKAMKAKYADRELHLITVKGRDGKDYSCIVKSPDRNTLAVASKFVDDPVRFNEVIFSNGWVEGDEELRTDDYLRLAAETKCASLVKIAESTIKKL